MKETTYKITLEITQEHADAMQAAGLHIAADVLNWDGERFREGSMFDIETWETETAAKIALEEFAAAGNFAPGMELVLTSETFDDETDEFNSESIMTRAVS